MGWWLLLLLLLSGDQDGQTQKTEFDLPPAASGDNKGYIFAALACGVLGVMLYAGALVTRGEFGLGVCIVVATIIFLSMLLFGIGAICLLLYQTAAIIIFVAASLFVAAMWFPAFIGKALWLSATSKATDEEVEIVLNKAHSVSVFIDILRKIAVFLRRPAVKLFEQEKFLYASCAYTCSLEQRKQQEEVKAEISAKTMIMEMLAVFNKSAISCAEQIKVPFSPLPFSIKFRHYRGSPYLGIAGKDATGKLYIGLFYEHLSKETIAHELAHIIDIMIRGRSIHDEYWQRINNSLGGADAYLDRLSFSSERRKELFPREEEEEENRC